MSLQRPLDRVSIHQPFPNVPIPPPFSIILDVPDVPKGQQVNGLINEENQ
jgi:hypothetical protein